MIDPRRRSLRRRGYCFSLNAFPQRSAGAPEQDPHGPCRNTKATGDCRRSETQFVFERNGVLRPAVQFVEATFQRLTERIRFVKELLIAQGELLYQFIV